jgi:hypothetical protein
VVGRRRQTRGADEKGTDTHVEGRKKERYVRESKLGFIVLPSIMLLVMIISDIWILSWILI